MESAPQQIPNMALTVATIKVTRFRSLTTPCVLRDKKSAYDRGNA